MRRTTLVRACALAAGLLALTAAPALGAIIELGKTKSPVVKPVCPAGTTAGNCTIVLTEVTALETLRDGAAYPTTVKQSGYIVAFTIGLAHLSSNPKQELQFIHHQDTNYGGTTRAGIVVLQPVGPHRLFKWKVVAQSPIIHLQPYLGQVAQFPLTTPLPVKAGQTIGLTVPTWAPVLTYQLSTGMFAYRQSRTSNCKTAFQGQPPATGALNQILAYKCDYPGTRVEYSATEITNPTPNKGG
ncbi:MAG: hypothetical protein M3076_12880 [Actinomycetota bacterium]|nr:hypothetical protein [Actinomycetota bacterium]